LAVFPIQKTAAVGLSPATIKYLPRWLVAQTLFETAGWVRPIFSAGQNTWQIAKQIVYRRGVTDRARCLRDYCNVVITWYCLAVLVHCWRSLTALTPPVIPAARTGRSLAPDVVRDDSNTSFSQRTGPTISCLSARVQVGSGGVGGVVTMR
jgi:hypothetical protein